MSATHEGVSFERLGHASVRIQTGDGLVLYIDPWSDVVEGQPGDADYVLVTHDDFDHYDPDGIEAVSGGQTVVAAYEAIDTEALDREVHSLPLEGETTIGEIEVRTVPAYNRSEGEHVNDEGEPFHAEGEVIGLLLDLGGITVYYPSDTDFLDLHREIRVDVFLPPIGGHYTMDREEAATFVRSVDPELVVPVHYDTFEPIGTDAEAFADDLEADGYRVELV